MQTLVDEANDSIKRYLHSQNIYERGNPPKNSTTIKGDYDIIGGAYRHIVNETRPNRNKATVVAEGDNISFMFVGRVFTGSSNSAVFYTNIEAVRSIVSNNPDFDPDYKTWPTDPLEIKVGSDPKILKSIQKALIGCRAVIAPPKGSEEEETTGEKEEEGTGAEEEEGTGNEDEGTGDEDEGSEDDEEEPAEDDEDKGIVSDEVRIYLPPDIAFGKHAIYGVPGGSTLLWEISDIKILKSK